MNLAISIDKPGPGTAVATMVGHLDVYSAPDARDALIGLINEARYRQVADLTRVEFLDSTGLAVLVGAWKRARAHGGALSLVVKPGSHPEKVLGITGVHKTIEAHDTVEDALECVGYAAALQSLLPPLGLSRAWAVWSETDGRLVWLTEYDTGPVDEARVRADLAGQIPPITGRYEPVSRERAAELRELITKSITKGI